MPEKQRLPADQRTDRRTDPNTLLLSSFFAKKTKQDKLALGLLYQSDENSSHRAFTSQLLHFKVRHDILAAKSTAPGSRTCKSFQSKTLSSCHAIMSGGCFGRPHASGVKANPSRIPSFIPFRFTPRRAADARVITFLGKSSCQ